MADNDMIQTDKTSSNWRDLSALAGKGKKPSCGASDETSDGSSDAASLPSSSTARKISSSECGFRGPGITCTERDDDRSLPGFSEDDGHEDIAEPRGCNGLTMRQLRRRLAVLSKEQLLELSAFGMFTSQEAFDAADALLDSDPASRRVMVRGLWYCTTDWTFSKYFSTFGELENAAVIRHPDGRSQGYGFLIYKDRKAAEEVISRRHYLDDRLVTAKLAADQYTEFAQGADGRKVSSERRKLFIRNICHGMTKDTLEKEFAVYGPIEECAIIRTTDKMTRGYGFVTFRNAADALRAAQTPFRVIQGWVVFVTFSTGKGRQVNTNKKGSGNWDVPSKSAPTAPPSNTANTNGTSNVESLAPPPSSRRQSCVPNLMLPESLGNPVAQHFGGGGHPTATTTTTPPPPGAAVVPRAATSIHGPSWRRSFDDMDNNRDEALKTPRSQNEIWRESHRFLDFPETTLETSRRFSAPLVPSIIADEDDTPTQSADAAAAHANFPSRPITSPFDFDASLLRSVVDALGENKVSSTCWASTAPTW